MSELGFMGEFDPDAEGRGDSPDGGRKEERKQTGESARADRPEPEPGGGKFSGKEEVPAPEASSDPEGKADRGNPPAEKQGALFDYKVDDSAGEAEADRAETPAAGGPVEADDGGSLDPLPGTDDADWLYNPTSKMWLQSLEGTDRPPVSPFTYVSGTRHPQLAEIERYLQEVEQGSLCLPAVTPLLNAPGQSPLDRIPYYAQQLSWQCQDRSTHILVLGKTGAGKNTRLIDLLRYSALQDPRQTVISVSLKALDYGPIKAACDQVGKKCIVVNFENDRRSAGFNPLRTAKKNEVPDIIRRFADSSRNPRSGDSEFWTQMVRTGLMALYEGGYRSFPEMYDFFTRSRKAMLRGLESIDSRNAEKLREFIAGASWNAETSEATIVGAFVAFQQESVQRVMSRDELGLDKLFEEPVCLHIEVDESSIETLRPLLQMLLRAVVDQLIKTAQRRGRQAIPATLFIDDMPSLGAIFSVERLLTLRSRKVGVVAGCQSIAALMQTYPHSGAAILEAFANQIVVPGCSPEDAEYFSRASGSQTVSLPAVPGQTPQYMVQPILSPADIRNPPYRHFLLGRPMSFFLGDQAFQAYVQYSYEVPQWRKLLHATRDVTGTEPLRTRRLPNYFTSRSRIGGRSKKKQIRPEQVRFPIKFSASDVKGWTEEAFRVAISRGLKQLDFTGANVRVRGWWDLYLNRNKKKLWNILNVISELVEMGSSMTEFYEMSDSTKSRDSSVTLAFMKYKRAEKAAVRRERLMPEDANQDKPDSETEFFNSAWDVDRPSLLADPVDHEDDIDGDIEDDEGDFRCGNGAARGDEIF